MLPPISPSSCSRSYGPNTWRAMTEALKFGARESYRSMTRSAYCSSSSRWGASAQSSGTHWVNIEKLWTPSGINVLSRVVGMTPSTNGRSAPFRNRWASWNASSAYWGEKHSSTEPVWWSWSSLPGSAMKSGSSLMARLIFTTPLRVRQFSMSRTKSAGSSFGARSRRKAIWGWIVVTTTGARISSPFSSPTPMGARVGRILVRGGRTCGVALENGEEFRAPVVVTTIHPQIAFLRLLAPNELPADFVRDIENWRTRSGVVKINLAISELPDFIADPGKELQDHHTGSVELCFSPQYAEEAFQDAHLFRKGAERPFVDGVIPTTLDKTLMPEGVHNFSMFTQWVPDDWAEEPHRDELEQYADRVIDLYDSLAPNFKASVIARQVLGPYDLEQELGLIGGNIFHGELSVDQLFHMRPAAGYADYRTPIRGLYHGSSATHAGGGVCGIPGWQAFRQAKRDRMLAKRAQ